MGDVASGGSPSARWQPTAADFVTPKDLPTRSAARRSTWHAPCSMSAKPWTSARAPSAAPRTRSSKPISTQKLKRRARHGLPMTPSPHRPPAGPYPIRNIIAKLPGQEGRDHLSSPATTTPTARCPIARYVGANDSGSDTGLLLELADRVRAKPLEGYSVWLVWLDGEEATVQSWTDTDSLYGSRHLAQLWQQDGTAKEDQSLLCCLTWWETPTSTSIAISELDRPWLEDLSYQAATRLGYQSHFLRPADRRRRRSPALCNGVPVADLIDFDYGYDNVFWHTPQDTLES